MSEALDEIKRRCKAAGLRFDWNEENPYHESLPPTVSILFPDGEGTYSVEIEGENEARWLMRKPFEKYRRVKGFDASWSPEYQVIECNLLVNESESLWTDEAPARIKDIFQQLGLELGDDEPLSPEHRVEIGSYDGLTISIGPGSDMHCVLSYYRVVFEAIFEFRDLEEDIPRVLTLRIERAGITEDEAAEELLKRVDDRMLSGIYVSLGLALSLERSEGYGADMEKAGKSVQLPLDDLLFWSKTVGVTGSGPYEKVALEKIVKLEGGIVGDGEIWQTNQLVIIGREDFDKKYLLRSVEFGSEHGFSCRYLSQEDFWRFWLGEPETTYHHGDPRIASHAGLYFLSSIGFLWPSLEFVLGHGGTEDFSDRLNDAHPLFSRFGYSVRKGITVKTRRERLQRAIEGPGALGLQNVVKHITFLVLYRRCNDRMKGAVGRWEEDLDWLYETYYKGKPHSFVWPNT